MCGKLDCYLKAFTRLLVDRNRKSWGSITNHCSLYKPFLLLSILDHIASGRITRNFIEPSFELTKTFLVYCALLPDLNRQASISYPFYHLESSGFWTLLPQHGQQHLRGRAIKSVRQLRRFYAGACFSDELLPAVTKESNLPGHIMILSDRPMLRPPASAFWPAKDNFDWHRRNRFRR